MARMILREDGSVLTGIKYCRYHESHNSDENLRFGDCTASKLELEVYNLQGVSVPTGERLSYYYVDQAGTETKYGEFTATASVPTRQTFRFEAYDELDKLGKDFSDRLLEIQINFPMSLRGLCEEACAVADVTFSQESWPMEDMEVQAFTMEGVTCRQILSWASEIAGRFVKCDENGVVGFAWYEMNADWQIAPGAGETDEKPHVYYKQDGLYYENYETEPIDAVSITPCGGDEISFVYPADGHNVYDIRQNLLIPSDPAVMETIAEHLLTVLNETSVYRPFEVSLFPFYNPFRAGQIVNVTDARGITFKSLVMNLSASDTDAVLESTGAERYETAGSYLDQRIEIAAKQIESRMRVEVNAAESRMRESSESLIQQSADKILFQVSESYYTTDAAAELEANISSTITQEANSLRIDFENLSTQVETDVGETATALTTIQSYIAAKDGTLTFGEIGNNITLTIENDRIGIYNNGVLITYWTANEMYSPNALRVPVGGRMVLGNFAFIPRTNGSLDFRWIGE